MNVSGHETDWEGVKYYLLVIQSMWLVITSFSQPFLRSEFKFTSTGDQQQKLQQVTQL